MKNPFFYMVPSLIMALSGCITRDISVENRLINVAPESEILNPPTVPTNIATIVQNAGPAYVTLVISENFNPGGGGKSANKAEDNNQRPISAGSGFVVDSSGYLMTAAHVALKIGNDVAARAANGRVYTGRVTALDQQNDVALIKLQKFRGQAVTPASEVCLARGTPVFSLGRPHGAGDTARLGHILSMSFGHAVHYGKFGYPDAMVLRMNTQKGESGGPVLNFSGKLQGMVVSTLTNDDGRLLNLAHALPLSRLGRFFCDHMSCSPAWGALAQQDNKGCSS